MARPLIDSLVHDATVKDESVKKVNPLKLRSFEQSINETLREKTDLRKGAKQVREHTSRKLNDRILLASLFLMAAIGSTYYLLDSREEIFQPLWITLSTFWYLGIAIYLLRKVWYASGRSVVWNARMDYIYFLDAR